MGYFVYVAFNEEGAQAIFLNREECIEWAAVRGYDFEKITVSDIHNHF